MRKLNKQNGMYALLVAVVTCIGITIYESCSADEDYDNFSTGNELFTLADGEMSLRSDASGINWDYVNHYNWTKTFTFDVSFDPNASTNSIKDTIEYSYDLERNGSFTEFRTINVMNHSNSNDSVNIIQVSHRRVGDNIKVYVYVRLIQNYHLHNPERDTLIKSSVNTDQITIPQVY